MPNISAVCFDTFVVIFKLDQLPSNNFPATHSSPSATNPLVLKFFNPLTSSLRKFLRLPIKNLIASYLQVFVKPFAFITFWAIVSKDLSL